MASVHAPIFAAVSCNLDNQLLQAALPLFEAQKIDAIEWSFDTLYKNREIPEWFVELLQTYGDASRLVGHGVYFSLFSGQWSDEQQRWLDHLQKVSSNFKFDHISEHFGFMTGADFHKGAPISIPYSKSTLALGTDRLKRMYNACQCPVGLENLAFAYSLEEVKRHGEFLAALIEPVNGFIILDLHNLYCQLQNFSQHFETLIEAYPLNRVREIHISGGSWEPSDVKPERNIRRDTHDDAVPYEVFDLLKKTLPLCPNVKFVILEQLGTALLQPESQQKFNSDFETMRTIIADFQATERSGFTSTFLPDGVFNLPAIVPEDKLLYKQQTELSLILEKAADYEDAMRELNHSSMKNSDWKIEDWSPHMLETAMKIAQKWKAGW